MIKRESFILHLENKSNTRNLIKYKYFEYLISQFLIKIQLKTLKFINN